MGPTPQKTSAVWLLYFLGMIALIGLTLGYAVSGPFYLLGRIFPPAHRLAGRLLHFAIWLLMKVEPWLVANNDLRPTPGKLAVSNHRSHLDAFLLLSRIPNVRMICKRELLGVPFLGLMMRATRQIPVKRGDAASYYDAMEELRRGLKAGDNVHVFGEMTRCEPGAREVGKFHLMPFQVAFREKIPVVPIVFAGTDDTWPKGSFGLRYRRPVLTKTLAPLDPTEFAGAAELAEAARRRIQETLSELHP